VPQERQAAVDDDTETSVINCTGDSTVCLKSGAIEWFASHCRRETSLIIVDRALEKRAAAGNPIMVGLVGAGYMGRALGRQFLTAVKGMHLAAVANRTAEAAFTVFRQVGVEPRLANDVSSKHHAVMDDPLRLCRTPGIDVIVEATNDVEFGSRVAFEAIKHGKHVVLLNAEVDGTVGPILKHYADQAGVIYTYTDGDEPGVAMNLFRFVDSIGYRPVLLGQIKGFLDHYRNPDTQQAFAKANGQKPAMVASFADGSKLAIESAILGNGTGFLPAVRGMVGHSCAHVRDLLQRVTPAQFANGGQIDFVLGAEPHTGAFVVGYNDDPEKQKYMKYFKFGEGPLYMFYTPYHLPHLQLPHSVARAALFHDATLAPLGAPVCDTLSVAKTDLKAGTLLDGMGGFHAYGMVDSYQTCVSKGYLPITLSAGCVLKRDLRKDDPIAYADVTLPVGRFSDQLRREMLARFPVVATAA
jgi:predicted homoserine dehydrogenase-like protein